MSVNSFNYRNLIFPSAVVILLLMLKFFGAILNPFILAMAAAYIMAPVVRGIQGKLKLKNKSLAFLLAFILLTIVNAGIIIGLFFIIKNELKTGIPIIQNYLKQAHIPEWVPEWIHRDLQDFSKENLKHELLRLEQSEDFVNFSKKALNSSYKGALGLLLFVFQLFSFTLYFIFISLGFDRFDHLPKVFPEGQRKNILIIAHEFKYLLNGYFKAQSKIVLWNMCLFSLGFYIIGLPFGIGMGIILGLMGYVPYLQLVGIIPCFLMSLMHIIGQGPDTSMIQLLYVLIVFVVVQSFQESVLTPKIMGNFSGLNPATVLLAVSLGGALLGIIGMIIAIPLATLIVTYMRRLAETNEEEEATLNKGV